MNPNCKVCGQGAVLFANTRILWKYDIALFRCRNCGFIQTEEPYWLEEAYTHSIVRHDTGSVMRAMKFSRIILMVLMACRSLRGRCLDFGGGWGLLTRVMRDYGIDFYHCDPHSENLLAYGFSGDLTRDYKLITACEVFEHLAAPSRTIAELIAHADHLLISTTLLPEPAPLPEDWQYYSLDSGQHIAFFSIESLRYLARTNGLNLYSDGRQYHLLTPTRLPRCSMNLVSWLSRIRLQLFLKPWIQTKTFEDSELARQHTQNQA